MTYLLCILGAIIDRLRGYDPADWYEQREMTAPKAATLLGKYTSRGIMAALFATIITGVSCIYDSSSWDYYHVGLFVVATLTLWIGGSVGRSRTYSAYNGKKATGDDLTMIVGSLIPFDNPIINRIRGMVEAGFYGVFLTGSIYSYLLLIGGHGDAAFNFIAFLITRGLAKGLVSFVPEKMSFFDVNWDTMKIEKQDDMELRNPIAELIDGFVLTYWLVETIV